MTVQFTQPEDTVGEADGMQLLTANKRERISLHIAGTLLSMNATGEEI